MKHKLARTSLLLSLPLLAAAVLRLMIGGDAISTAAPTTAPSTSIGVDPIEYRHIVREDPPLHLHVVTVNLRDPRVRLRVCPGGPDPDGEGPWQTTIRTVREIAQANNLRVAVNANFFTCKDAKVFAGRKIPYFNGNWSIVTGFAMTDGKMWSRFDGGVHSLMVTRAGKVQIGYFARHVPEDALHVASGSGLYVENGKIVATNKDHAPRTIVGLNRDASKLIMLVVDGRKNDYSVGLTGEEAAKEMIELGCWTALNLDGGGSSTMAMQDESGTVRVMNRPSDGHDLPIALSLERPVACALGVEVVDEKK